MPNEPLFQRLKERKLVQWGFAYLAGAWALAEAADVVGGRWGLPDVLYQGLFVVLGVGFFITVVIAWYHGEKGRQTVSGPELLMVAALLVVAGGVLALLPGPEPAEVPEEAPAGLPVEDDRPSIAVLPFENFSTDSTYAFFSNAMQEQILSTLAEIPGLRVISRTSVMQYQASRPISREIADELRVSHLVEGSAQVAAGQVRLSVQLIDAQRDEHLWAEDFDRELTAENLFEVRSEVARQIAFQVGVKLTSEQRDQIASVLTDNTDAFLLYLQGNEAFLDERQRGQASSMRSARLYEQALEFDPHFALAHARLALSLTYSNGFRRAEEEARAALSAIPGLPEGRVALGRYWLLVGEAEEAKRQFQAAEAEAPNLSLAVLELGLLQRSLGEFDAGLRTLRRAEDLDPRNPVIQRALVRSLIFQHRYDDALEASRIREAVYPSYAGIRDRIWIYLLRGDSVRARLAIDELLETDAWGFYNFVPGLPYEIVRRVLTREERQTAFESYFVYLDEPEGTCAEILYYCLRRAIHEQAAGSREVAGALWDSLRVGVDAIPPENSSTSEVLAYQGSGDKEAAIRAAEEYVSAAAEGWFGGVPDLEYIAPSSRILLARILAHFDELDRSIDLLEELLPAPSWLTVHILEIDPVWDPLRDHPRFQALLEKYAYDVEH